MSGGFRMVNARVIVPLAMTLMILGFIFLCQPWSAFLHNYSVVITLIGLVLFSIFARLAPAPRRTDASDHG